MSHASATTMQTWMKAPTRVVPYATRWCASPHSRPRRRRPRRSRPGRRRRPRLPCPHRPRPARRRPRHRPCRQPLGCRRPRRPTPVSRRPCPTSLPSVPNHPARRHRRHRRHRPCPVRHRRCRVHHQQIHPRHSVPLPVIHRLPRPAHRHPRLRPSHRRAPSPRRRRRRRLQSRRAASAPTIATTPGTATGARHSRHTHTSRSISRRRALTASVKTVAMAANCIAQAVDTCAPTAPTAPTAVVRDANPPRRHPCRLHPRRAASAPTIATTPGTATGARTGPTHTATTRSTFSHPTDGTGKTWTACAETAGLATCHTLTSWTM